jgi:hypothetical protein
LNANQKVHANHNTNTDLENSNPNSIIFGSCIMALIKAIIAANKQKTAPKAAHILVTGWNLVV